MAINIDMLRQFSGKFSNKKALMKSKMFDHIKISHFDNPSRTAAMTKKKYVKILTKNTMNQQLVKMEFAVKGPVLSRALKHQEELRKGVKKNFNELIFTNQGDSHAMGQPPITFLRQVLACCVYPDLCQLSLIPDDVKERAGCILGGCLNRSMGAYTDSQGMYVVRQHIAEYITKRDEGTESNPNNIFIMDGASAIIKLILSMFCKEIACKPTGVMLPIPLYPLYSALLTELKLSPIFYYLDEDKNWGLDMKELTRALEEAKCTSVPRLIVVVNPGNPTGQVLKRKNVEDVIRFAHKEKLAILADEVYQENIFDEHSDFYSFKKVKHELGPPYDGIELASFISVSKGYTGECGLRGGCVELDGFDNEALALITKASSVSLCSNTVGQAALSIITKPPEPGDVSYEEFMREKCCILNGLAAKARLVTSRINKIDGLKVNKVQGSLYAMVKIEMPDKAIKAAKDKGLLPDVMWCYELLDSKGIVVVPGSGFGQKPGTHHFRTTILPPFETMEKVTKGIKEFQADFKKRYRF